MRTFDPEGERLPVKLDPTSNGEFSPVPLDETGRIANRLAQRQASDNARRRGVSRRAFMVSSCGAASTLLAFNAAYAAAGRTGGAYAISPAAALDPQLAAAELEGDEEVRLRARSDRIWQERIAYRERPNPHYLTWGPRTRRDFLRLLRASGGRPG